MAQAYTPGLLATPHLHYRARRVLPIAGQVLVQPGQQVEAQQVVARTELPGDVTPINLANLLAMPPGEVASCLLKREGERVEVGELLARTKGIFGFLRSEYVSKVSGTLESISSVTGQVLIRGPAVPVEVRAFVAGRIAEVLPNEGCIVEAEVALVQGIFGVGGETYGVIRTACNTPDQPLTPECIQPDMRGAIIVGGGRMTGATVRRAIEVGAAAIISGGIDDADLRDILGYDLGVAITGTEHLGITLVITEGFGEIGMAVRTFELLRSHEGAPASVNGATQIRAGVLRPEIVIPVHASPAGAEPVTQAGGVLEVGATVRIIRDPWFGQIGTVTALPSEPQVLGSGSRARVLMVRDAEGVERSVPRANVELITT